MDRRADGDQIDAARLERDVLDAREAVFDALAWRRVLELLGAGIGGEDAVEVLDQSQRGLAVAGPAVPRQLAARRE